METTKQKSSGKMTPAEAPPTAPPARQVVQMQQTHVLGMRLARERAARLAAEARNAQLEVQLVDAQIVATYGTGSVDLDKGTITLDAPSQGSWAPSPKNRAPAAAVEPTHVEAGKAERDAATR